MNPKIRATLSLIITTAIGALVAYVTATPMPTGEKSMTPFWVGAGIAVAAALVHLFQNPPTQAGQAAAAIVSQAKDQSGFVSTRILLVISLMFVLGSGIGAIVMACNPANTAADINATKCILTTAADDYDKGLSPAAILADVERVCLVDEITAITTLDRAQKAADATRAARVRK